MAGSSTRSTISYLPRVGGRHVCVHRLQASVDCGSGQLSTRVQAPPDLNLIDSALVGVDPPQMMPVIRYSVRPSTRHFSTRIGIAVVSITTGEKSRANFADGAWCVRAANSSICDVAGA